MKSHLALVFMFLCFVSIQICSAGGSVSFDENVKPLLDKQPALKKLIADTFEVPASGSGIRLGRQYANLWAQRIGPYEFEVTSKASGKKFLLTIHCETIFKLPNGKAAKGDDTLKAVTTQETVTHFSVAPIKKGGNGPEDK